VPASKTEQDLLLACLAHLEQEEAFQTQLLELAQGMRDVLIKGDLEGLARILRERQDLERLVQERKAARRRLQAQAAVLLRESNAAITLTDIVQRLGPEAGVLRQRLGELKRLANRIARLNLGNALLIRHHLEFLHRVLHQLIGEPASVERYRPAGTERSGCSGVLLQTQG
jgi:hypothetical protein